MKSNELSVYSVRNPFAEIFVQKLGCPEKFGRFVKNSFFQLRNANFKAYKANVAENCSDLRVECSDLRVQCSDLRVQRAVFVLDHLEVRAKEAALNLTTAEIDSIMEHTHNVLGRIIDAEGGHVRQ